MSKKYLVEYYDEYNNDDKKQILNETELMELIQQKHNTIVDHATIGDTLNYDLKFNIVVYEIGKCILDLS